MCGETYKNVIYKGNKILIKKQDADNVYNKENNVINIKQ